MLYNNDINRKSFPFREAFLIYTAIPPIKRCYKAVLHLYCSATATAVVVTVVSATCADDENKKNNPAASVSTETIVTHMSFLLSSTLHNIQKGELCYNV